MVALFVLFAIFAISIPVILEARRTGGDNILRQAGLEILDSETVKQLKPKTGAVPASLGKTAASAGSFAIVMLVLWLLVSVMVFIF